MGIIKEARHLKKVREFESLVIEVFGMSVKEIKEKLVEEKKVEKIEPTAEEQEKIIENANKDKDAGDVIEAFNIKVEEFNEDGFRQK